MRFYQPGIGNDFDSDLDTGVAAPTDSDTLGVTLGFPIGGSAMGSVIDIDPDVTNAGTGAEDRLTLFAPDGSYAGGFNFGGFQCPIDGDISTYIPAAILAFEMWGPGDDINTCQVDLNNDGVLNFFDVSLFIMSFGDFNPMCDLNNDGVCDFFDISLFIQLFTQGCHQDP